MKKIGLICLAVVLGLGALGVGYAYWSDILTINGTVATGEFDTNFKSGSIIPTDNEEEPPEVGTCEVSGVGDKTFTVTIGNGYPCYEGTVTFQIQNDGTIPAKISSIKIDGTEYAGAVEKDLSGTAATDISISISGIAVGNPIAVGSSVGGAVVVHVCELSVEGHDADENASGDFEVTIETIQFNAP